jgi:hypothetical protein
MSASSPHSPTGYRYVVIEGPIGVGKTSLAQKLAPLMGVNLVLEHAEDNPFLERFYRSPRTGALRRNCFSCFSVHGSCSNCGRAIFSRRYAFPIFSGEGLVVRTRDLG